MEQKKYRFMALAAALMGYAGGIVSAFFAGVDQRTQMEGMVTLLLSGENGGGFLSAFCSGPLFVLAEVCAGLFLFGFVLILPILFFKTYGLGYSAGMCYAVLGKKGILAVLCGVLPSGVLITALMVLAAEAAFPYSLSFLKKRREGGCILINGVKAGPLSVPEPSAEGEEAKTSSLELERYLTRGLLTVLLSASSMIADLYLCPFLLSSVAGWM